MNSKEIILPISVYFIIIIGKEKGIFTKCVKKVGSPCVAAPRGGLATVSNTVQVHPPQHH